MYKETIFNKISRNFIEFQKGIKQDKLSYMNRSVMEIICRDLFTFLTFLCFKRKGFCMEMQKLRLAKFALSYKLHSAIFRPKPMDSWM